MSVGRNRRLVAPKSITRKRGVTLTMTTREKEGGSFQVNTRMLPSREHSTEQEQEQEQEQNAQQQQQQPATTTSTSAPSPPPPPHMSRSAPSCPKPLLLEPNTRSVLPAGIIFGSCFIRLLSRDPRTRSRLSAKSGDGRSAGRTALICDRSGRSDPIRRNRARKMGAGRKNNSETKRRAGE